MTTRAWAAFVIVVIAAGVALRVWIISGHLGALDADEAIVGSMAVHLGRGHLVAFFWGQEYGGSGEPVLTGALFALAGRSVVALKLVPTLLSGVAAVLVWRVARRVVEERTAQAAALLFWVAPGVYVWWATKARGFYWLTLVCGLVVLLAALDVSARRRERRAWVLLGASAGVGWWSSPAIVYFVAPAAVWLLVRHRRALLGAWLAIPSALLGASPWLWHGTHHGWHTLDRPSQPETVSYAVGLGRLVWRVLPMTMNLQRAFTQATLFPLAFPWVYVATLLALAVAFALRRDRPALIGVGLVVYPLVYAALPGAWFIGEARYAFFIAPFLAIAVVWMLRDERLQALLVSLAACLSVVAMRPIHFPSPTHVGADIAALEAAGIDRLWLDYFLATRITFESNERVIAASSLYVRYPPHHDAVADDPTGAYGYRIGDPKLRVFEDALAARGIAIRIVRTPHLVVVLPAQRIAPEALPPAARP